MRIQTRGPGPHPDLAINGTTATIAGELIDCEAAQGAGQVIIDVRRDAHGHVRLGGHGYQLASVTLPPTRYQDVDTGETDEQGHPVIERQAVALDPDTIQVILWTV